MNVASIRKFDVANGPGVRSSIFFSGCTHNCKGCFNSIAKDFNYGELFDEEKQNDFIKHINSDVIQGVSILGGEPLQQGEDMLYFLERIKKETGKNIWLWTGYTFEEILEDKDKYKMLEYIDVLIDGKFVQELKDINLMYKGSKNQRVIDVKKTLKLGYIYEIKKEKF